MPTEESCSGRWEMQDLVKEYRLLRLGRQG